MAKNNNPNILLKQIVNDAKQNMDGYSVGTFYISVEENRDWQSLISGWNNQRVKTLVTKIKHIIESNGGKDLQIIDSLTDTRIYFKMNRLLLVNIYSQISGMFHNVSVGEVVVKSNSYT